MALATPADPFADPNANPYWGFDPNNPATPAPPTDTDTPPPAPTDTSAPVVGGPEPAPYNPSPSAPSTYNTGITGAGSASGFSTDLYKPGGSYVGVPGVTSPITSQTPGFSAPPPPTQSAPPRAPGQSTPGSPANLPTVANLGVSSLPTVTGPLPGQGVTPVTSAESILPAYRQTEGQWKNFLSQGGGGARPSFIRSGLYEAPPGRDLRAIIGDFHQGPGYNASYVGGPGGGYADFGDRRGPVRVRTGGGQLFYDEGKQVNQNVNAGGTPPPPGGWVGQGAGSFFGGPVAAGPMGGGGAYQPSSTFSASGLTNESAQDIYRKAILAAMGQGLA